MDDPIHSSRNKVRNKLFRPDFRRVSLEVAAISKPNIRQEQHFQSPRKVQPGILNVALLSEQPNEAYPMTVGKLENRQLFQVDIDVHLMIQDHSRHLKSPGHCQQYSMLCWPSGVNAFL